MTDLLDHVISRLRERPAAEQDEAAQAILAFLDREEPPCRLTPGQVEDVERIQEELRTGKMRLATDHDVDQLWRSFGA